MIRRLVDQAFNSGKYYISAVGLSTDVKPTEGIITGSKFVEVDTGIGYLFDETSGEWHKNQQLSAAVQAYFEDHPEAIDQAAIEAMFGEQLDGIEEDIGGLKSALTHNSNTIIGDVKHVYSTQFIDLFSTDDADYQSAHGYDGSTGTIVSSNAVNLSGYIPFFKGEKITVYFTTNNYGTKEGFFTGTSTGRKIGYYDVNKNWVKTITDFSSFESDTIEMTTNGFVRFQFSAANQSALVIYKDSIAKIDGKKVTEIIHPSDILTGKLANWLNPYSDNYLVGYAFSGDTGTIVSSTYYHITDYIHVYRGKNVTIPYADGTSFFTSTTSGIRKIAFYDNSKTWVKTVTLNNSSTPYTQSSVDFDFDGYIRASYIVTYIPIAIYVEPMRKIAKQLINAEYGETNWYAIGDSITDGRYSYKVGDTVLSDTDHYGYYGYIASQILGMNMYEYGYSGMGYVATAGDGTTLVDVLAMDFDNPNLITVALGINDRAATTGNESSTALDGTFSGAVKNTCEVLGAKYPNAQIIFLSPINSNQWGTQETIWCRKASMNNNLDAQRNIIKYWCDVYNYKFIDMTVECPINVFNIVSLLPDKLHPSKDAHMMIGKWLAGALPRNN